MIKKFIGGFHMRKISLFTIAATLFLLGVAEHSLSALTYNDLSAFDREVLSDYESRGRFAFVWYDEKGNTHISAINGGINIRSALPGWYDGCTLDGGKICLYKDGCGNYILNGVLMRARYFDCKSWHSYLVPSCNPCP